MILSDVQLKSKEFIMDNNNAIGEVCAVRMKQTKLLLMRVNRPVSSHGRGHLGFVCAEKFRLHFTDFCFFKLQLGLQRLNLQAENTSEFL